MIAAVMSPGMPSAIKGVSAPPSTALFDASGAMIPRGSPLPKLESFLAAFFAWSYDRMLAIDPPAPGRIQ